VGLDIAQDAADYCRKQYPDGDFHTLDLTSDRWPIETLPASGFDLVTAIDVLYHLVDDRMFEAAIVNLASRVRPGGALLISDVFVPQDRQIAAHVKRRSLETYRRALGEEFSLQGREPVFAILADPLPRSPLDLSGQALLAAWRVLARIVLYAPDAARNTVGAAAATLARPVDALLRRAGMASGVNLELALFIRK
jgi:SAM-dependent methyltransferase